MSHQDIAAFLEETKPGAIWSLTGEAFSDLVWLDAAPAPSASDFNAWFAGQTTAALIAYANAKQWSLAMGGATVTLSSSGGPTKSWETNMESLSLINGKITRLTQPDPPASFTWQFSATDFVTLSPANVMEAGTKIEAFIQACFDALASVTTGIVSGTITTTAQIDAAAWPSNSL